ncbi:hypothetical protein [Spirosoma agri]|uniref:Uncharacterized protein n=1 Tax=Spirosoma agri TaxID=1987381 RepID=A0A6M0IMX1_9BACT|nr:hypothetical protein [Spirosoma agri]NEU68273.1 hypothetical protein [Spirosoma agri]
MTTLKLIGWGCLVVALLINIPFWIHIIRHLKLRSLWRELCAWWLLRSEDLGGLLLIVLVVAFLWVGLLITCP